MLFANPCRGITPERPDKRDEPNRPIPFALFQLDKPERPDRPDRPDKLYRLCGPRHFCVLCVIHLRPLRSSCCNFFLILVGISNTPGGKKKSTKNFAFVLTDHEVTDLRSQFATSSLEVNTSQFVTGSRRHLRRSTRPMRSI